jgi:hypothetical protein
MSNAANMDTQSNTISIGDTFESGTLRVHRFRDTLKLWDVTHAGKRGKKVRFCYTSPAYVRGVTDADREELLEKLAAALTTHSSYDTAAAVIGRLAAEYPELLRVESGEYRGVDVAPAGFTSTTVYGKRVTVGLEHDSFRVVCNVDENNQPRICHLNGGRANIAKFAEWLKQNRKSLATMDLAGVQKSLSANGIQFHYYLGMD